MHIGKMDFLINAKSRNQLVIVYLSQGMPYTSQLLVLNIYIKELKNISGSKYFTIYYNCFQGEDVIKT